LGQRSPRFAGGSPRGTRITVDPRVPAATNPASPNPVPSSRRRGVIGPSLASGRNGSRPGSSAVIAGLPGRWRGDGVVDEDGGDGGGGGEAFAVEDSGAGGGAIDEQRQLFAELF